MSFALIGFAVLLEATARQSVYIFMIPCLCAVLVSVCVCALYSTGLFLCLWICMDAYGCVLSLCMSIYVPHVSVCSACCVLRSSLTFTPTMRPVACGTCAGCSTLAEGWGVRGPAGPTCTLPAAPPGGSPPHRAPPTLQAIGKPWTP